ncbi:hypothetical protein HQ81_0243 [Dickeya phage phiDP23.1]|uniref:Uncharacterized protein n=3 Tax=Aglimvirinae TaxID=2169530 RepID=A0A075E061_9CAUD|nr:hypothetical protein DA66_0101 [Dickeya phage RC-2014]AHZ60150.1 hypothetical protein DA66_0101 [Dickeya phage RC-2014]AIM51712.1 hypothetical protein HQ82_0188 [Dickeya phage phiDP10.3]AIM51766.1 hypothetical protein HQ81_0243 [Dickeya phage phiDP23.1]
MSSNLVATEQSVSQILKNARTQKGRLCDLLADIRGIRIQLDGDFPSANSDKTAQQPLPGLIGAIIDAQSSQDEIIESITNHLNVIHSKLGSFYHPDNEDEAKEG